MFPVFQIGHVAFQAPGLILIAGVYLALSLADRFAPVHGIPPAKLDNLVFIALAAGAVGGRMSYALENLSAFIASPLSLVSPNYQLFDLPGGLLIGLAPWKNSCGRP
jgi:phosphatidylglycerol:prolipoprotein diacylglycerol transferase